MEQYRVLEDLRYEESGEVVIPKGSIVEKCDDFPFYRIICPKLQEIEEEKEKLNKNYYADFDNYGMEVHMSDIKSIEELPWHGKLELIK